MFRSDAALQDGSALRALAGLNDGTPAAEPALVHAAQMRIAQLIDTGNIVIAELQKDGVEFEECAVTARGNDWINSDLLPDVKVNTGGNLRITELVQEGFVQLQP